MKFQFLSISVFILVMLVVVVMGFVWWSRKNKTFSVYCISLVDHGDRRDNLMSLVGDDVSIEFVPAVDTRGEKWMHYFHFLDDEGKDQMAWATTKKARRRHSDLTQGAIGCFLSHIVCYEKFVNESGDDVLVILEDDSAPGDQTSFRDNLKKIINGMPDGTDVCMIHHEIHGRTVGCQMDDRYLAIDATDPGSRFYRTNCYVITREGAQKMLDIFRKNGSVFHDQIDSYMTKLVKDGNIQMYFWHDTTVCPPSVYGETTIQTIGVVEQES